MFICLHKLGNLSENSRCACARAQHVIIGMLAAMNTRKACHMGVIWPADTASGPQRPVGYSIRMF